MTLEEYYKRLRGEAEASPQPPKPTKGVEKPKAKAPKAKAPKAKAK